MCKSIQSNHYFTIYILFRFYIIKSKCTNTKILKTLLLINKILSSSFFRLLENVITVVTSLLLTPYLIGVLGREDYGLWLLTLSILGWFNIIHLGFPAAVQRHITWSIEKDDDEGVKVAFSTSIVLFLCLGGAAVTGLVFIASNPSILVEGADKQNLLSMSLFILCLKVLWDFFMCAFNGFFACLMRYDIDANISSVNAIAKALLVYFLLPQFHILGAIAATLIADFMSNLLKIFYVKRIYPKLSFKLSHATFSEVKSLFSFSKHVIATGVAKTIGTKADAILVTKLFELALVPIFGIANRLAVLVEGFTASVSGVFLPIFNKLAANNSEMETAFKKISIVNISVYAILYTVLLIFAELFIKLWVGEEFHDSVLILNVLVFSCLCRAVFQSIRDVLFAQANHKQLSWISLFGAVFNILLSIYLAKQYGLVGIAIATGISFLISDVILGLYLLRKHNPYNISFLVYSFISSVLLTYGIGLSGQFVIREYFEQSWFVLMALGIVVVPVVVITYLWVFFDKEMKHKVISLLPFKKA